MRQEKFEKRAHVGSHTSNESRDDTKPSHSESNNQDSSAGAGNSNEE